MKAVQQQSEQLLGIMLPSITELCPHGELSDPAQEVGGIHSVVIALGIHLHPNPPIAFRTQLAVSCRT